MRKEEHPILASPKNKRNYPLDRVGAILSMNRALWGEVSPSLRVAKINWDDRAVYLKSNFGNGCGSFQTYLES